MNARLDWVEEAWQQVISKISRTSHSIGASFPNGSANGHYDRSSPHDWVAGFWPGLLWLVYRETKDDRFKQIAVECERQISQTLWAFDQLHHDVGFMFGLSSINQYLLLEDEEAKRHALMAASLLAGRFNAAGGFIRAWPNWGGEDHSGWAIIDCLMNLPLLYWASQEINDPRYRHIADIHADTVLREFLLEDGSVHHIVSFNPETGERIEALAGQGYAADSAWARGAAWALYGFARCYSYTGKVKYAIAAKRVATFFLDHLPVDNVPYWDFRLPEFGDDAPRDSSAAAIAASGLIELAEGLPGVEGEMYKQRAADILRSLHENYGAWDSNEEGLLLHATGYFDKGIYVDAPLIYGDYYFAEALLKLKDSAYAKKEEGN
ncbi:unsaturated chondroitin disaccharide hydrolase [Paenibacillus endophyticus]|uniref:Unsaturated chondroitin disaccharide hydrolase n=1 Tax=Paenibacillus endophyticus TaxID=1294268 RepID=A0A7W5G987_9BACL|nr:glycoside hydrolase family 88 protein [Paenibacillus endophyticus]MBB3151869.1 unsaturated chondroitin disaccharide hydrolase [Paenibacillus endophyticus]